MAEELELQEEDFISSDQDELSEADFPHVARKGKRPAKPLPVEKKQAFTPKIPDQPFGKGSFRFETTPFRETPESYQLRSKETPTGPERLRREEMLAAKRGEQLKSLRQASPAEAKELKAAQEEQDLYDKFGPAAYGVRKGLVNFVKSSMEPFTQSAEEFVSIPGDTSALISGGVSELGKRQEARDRARNLQFDRNVIRQQESIFERGLPSLIEIGGNLLLNPRAPKQVSQGFRPPPDLSAGIREPRLLPSGPSPKGAASRRSLIQDSYRPSATGMEFSLVPSSGPGKAPVMIVPDWVIATLSRNNPEDVVGFNITTNQADAIATAITNSPVVPELQIKALNQLELLRQEAIKAGVNSVSILNEGYDTASLARSIFHETFHAGQNQAVQETNRRMFGNELELPTSIEMLHDSEWARGLPVIQTLLSSNPRLIEALGSTTGFEPHDILRAELPAYTMEGRGYLFFETSADAIDDLFDYFMHVADRNGVEALDVIQTVATIRPGMEDAIPLARSMYENWQRERRKGALSSFSSESPRAGQLSNTSPSLQGAAAGGIESRSGQGGITPIGSATSGGSERNANLARFLEHSQVKVPVYHGTQSSTEIKEVDPKKFDDDALYGPGFYTTQAPQVAAGEGGYVDTKVYKARSDAEIDQEIERRLIEAGVMTPGEDLTGLSLRVQEREGPDSPKLGLIDRIASEVQETGYGNRPHAYKVHLDIRNAFRMDDPFTIEQLDKAAPIMRKWLGEDSILVENAARNAIEGKPADFGGIEITVPEYTGSDFFRKLRSAGMDKAEISELFKEMGYDGITHIGGRSEPPKRFNTLEEAQVYSDQVGTPVREVQWNDYPTRIVDGRWLIASKSRNSGRYIHTDGRDEFTDLAEAQVIADYASQHPNYEVGGHKVWIAFRPEQVKSATGNIGAFDPTNLQISFSKTNLGDLVKVKGYSQSAEVVGEGDEPGTMKVKFPDGTIDEFDVNDLKQKGKRIKDPMVAQLQKNPPGPPPDPGAEVYGPRSPLRVSTITTSYQEAIARKFVELLQQEKLDVDLTDPPSKQIYEALMSGNLREDSVDAVLKEEGVTWEQFIQDQLQSYSKAGRDLSILSRLERDLERMLKTDPVKFGKYVAPQKQMEVILRVLNRSVLGRTLWSRYGGLIQKMVLTKLTTALVNTRTTIARAAVDAASEGLGAWMQNMSEGKGKFWDRVKESKDDAIEAMAASYEIVKALNPGQLEALINRNKRTAYQQQQEIITQVEKFHPEIHAKLFARPISGEIQQRVDAEKYVHLANSLLPRVKNASTRRDMKNQIRVIENRLKFEKSLFGKATLRGPEIVYDTMLIPLQFAEFIFRRPKFIGRLRLELMDRGIDLDEVLRQTALTKEEFNEIPLKDRMAFKDIPDEAIKAALNNTLELTYAYDPSTDKEAPIMERAAGYFIKTMNALGPGAILGELFPRAIYNGMKTLYEYSPAPFLTATPELMFGSRGKSPIAKILRPTYDADPKTQAKYKVNPPTRYDWERLAKAMIGSLMLFVAWDMIRQGGVGDEWWQLGDPTKKDAEGQSTYYDVRKDRPFSEYFHLASLAERYRRGTIGDKQLGNELLEIYTGIRRTDASPDFLDTINAAGELFGASPQSPGRKLAMIEAGGRHLAIPFTPILNLRDMWAIYSEEENKLKDTRGIWYGPIQDKFPWWRRSLPDLTSPIEPGPIHISKDPDLLMTAGMQFTEGPNFAGREWQRLGLNYKNFLERDPDPLMNRAQNVYFEREMRRIGDMFENLPYYTDADDQTKAAIWESVVAGDNGIAAQAQQFATLANPMEAEARKLQGRMPGRLQRKKYGLDKVLQGIRDIGDERR